MKHRSIAKQYLSLAVGLFAFLATGCIKEDLEECYKLTLKVENAKGDDITASGDVAASLFIFDENYNFLEKRKLDNQFVASRQEIVLDYPESRQLHIVAWGNEGTVDSDNQEIIDGQAIEDLKLMLKTNQDLAQSPDALYYGNRLVTTKAGGGIASNDTVVIRIKTGTISMQTEGLQYALNKYSLRSTGECDFLMNRTLSGYDYQGEQIGDSVYYNPDGKWDDATQTEWVSVKNENVCYGENLGFSLKIGETELAYRDRDDNGDPINIQVGDNTHVIFQFGEDGTLVSLKVEVRPWSEVDDNIEF